MESPREPETPDFTEVQRDMEPPSSPQEELPSAAQMIMNIFDIVCITEEKP